MRRVLHTLSTALGLYAACTGVAQVTWRTDSLMSTWAVQQRLAEVGGTLGRGVVRAVDTDDLYTDLKREAPGIPVFADSNVVLYADLYGEPLREQFRVLLGVSQVYFPMIEKELALQGLPPELKYLPMALSAMNTQAAAANGRGGLWMLTYPVALRYGLTMTGHVDERHDDVKSTMAAGRYLKALHARYRDWGLAIMAFACGPANVTRAQQRSGGATDYRSLYPHFTEGEAEVLPLLMAFIHLSANAGALGLEPIEVMPWEVADTLTATRPMQLKALAQVMQLPLARVQALNPTLCSGEVPTGHPFHVPRLMAPRYATLTDSIQRVEEALAQATAAASQEGTEQLVSVVVEKSIRYKVRSGDNLGSIAAKHHVTVRQIRSWNNLRSDRINAGRTLIIKVKKRELVKPTEPEPQLPEDEGPVNSTTPTTTEERAVKPAAPKPVAATSYTVQRGDTLYRIAKRFPGLTAQTIMEANGISTAIRPGQKLKIPRP
ncbi:MAG: LysM peptidoglycan-binding domain-containing protein [Flavobacteriales bacterium]|nr:LysM peptidoglycan-binding domain-containing protein [Flavobacteriales bacterium]